MRQKSQHLASCLTQSQGTDTGSTSPSAYPIMPDATATTCPVLSFQLDRTRIRTRVSHIRGVRPNHYTTAAIDENQIDGRLVLGKTDEDNDDDNESLFYNYRSN